MNEEWAGKQECEEQEGAWKRDEGECRRVGGSESGRCSILCESGVVEGAAVAAHATAYAGPDQP